MTEDYIKVLRQEGRELHIDEIEDSYCSDELQGTLRGATRRTAAMAIELYKNTSQSVPFAVCVVLAWEGINR